MTSLWSRLLGGKKKAGRRPTPPARLTLELLEDRLAPSGSYVNFNVTNTNDSGKGSLRAAILKANATHQLGFINIEPGLGSSNTINLLSALPALTHFTDIVGPGAGSLTIERSPQASGSFGIFSVGSKGNVGIIGLTMGNTTSAAISNMGFLFLFDDLVSGVSATSSAGGIFNQGFLYVDNSTIANNSTSGGKFAAGIDSEGGSVTITSSTISNNTATTTGKTGGIGIYGGTLAITNSTVTANVASDPGTSGGGIDADGTSASIFDTIVAGNTGASGNGSDVSGTFTSQGHNLIGSAESHSSGFVISDLVGTVGSLQAAGLDSQLRDNGGPTPTYALVSGSPAIAAGDSTNAPDTDQRGLPRIINGAIDIGAYEFGSPSQLIISGGPSTANTGDTATFTVTAETPDGQTATGYQGTVDLSSSDPVAQFQPASYSFQSSDSGQHNFDVTFRTGSSKAQTVTFTDSLAKALTGSTSVTVTATAAAPQVVAVGIDNPFNQPAGPKAFRAGQTIYLYVYFDRDVIVTGKPQLRLNVTPTAVATYYKGSGSSVLFFQYKVPPGSNVVMVNYTSTTDLLLPKGASIKDANGATPAVLTLPGTSSADDGLGSNVSTDSTRPTVSLTGQPTSPLSSGAPAVFTFTGSDNQTPTANLVYMVRLDNGTWSTAPGTQTYNGLAKGSHTFQVKAIDEAGNVSKIVSFTFKVE